MPVSCYLDTGTRGDCFGCGACVDACACGALSMTEDAEGFAYPVMDEGACVHCGACRRACPRERPPEFGGRPELVFGGWHRDPEVLGASTSGGAFSAIVEAWFLGGGRRSACGAVAHGLDVTHEFVGSAEGVARFRKSKYVQSRAEGAYREARRRLGAGEGVLFSGTPCQVAGLLSYLGPARDDLPGELLTVEVVCEGVPSPVYIRKYAERLGEAFGSPVASLDYRDKDGARWDFQVMSAKFKDGRVWKVDRWFNPFWSIWLRHLMSRPSCYGCPFARPERVADVTLGDLWGVHLYCPELYNGDAGASLVVCGTGRGRKALEAALPFMEGHALALEDALRYQSPMRRPVPENPGRAEFMADLATMGCDGLDAKWAQAPTPELLFSKYVWGNRQEVALWDATRCLSSVSA